MPETSAELDLQPRLLRLEKQCVLMSEHFGEAFWMATDSAYKFSRPHRRLRCIVRDHSAPRGAFELLIDGTDFRATRMEAGWYEVNPTAPNHSCSSLNVWTRVQDEAANVCCASSATKSETLLPIPTHACSDLEASRRVRKQRDPH